MENKININPQPILPSPEEIEVWKVHPIYTAYEISTFGNVRRADTKRPLTPNANARGYAVVHLRCGIANKNGKTAKVHKLVADTFLEPGCSEQVEIDHQDRDRMNNYYKNLRWVSHKENIKNTKSVRRQYVYMDRPALVLLDKNTHELIQEFKNLAEASAKMGVSPPGIRDNIHGVKPPYKFGYFMIKDEYLQRIADQS